MQADKSKQMEKKMAAALAAVQMVLAAEQAAAAQAISGRGESGPRLPEPLRLWGISGRQSQMADRQQMQMRVFR